MRVAHFYVGHFSQSCMPLSQAMGLLNNFMLNSAEHDLMMNSILLINVKMRTIVDIFKTFISRIYKESKSFSTRKIYLLNAISSWNFMLSWVEHGNSFKTPGQGNVASDWLIFSDSVETGFADWLWGNIACAFIPTRPRLNFHFKIGCSGLSYAHLWKFSGLFLNSGFLGWLSIGSQPQNAELGRQ